MAPVTRARRADFKTGAEWHALVQCSVRNVDGWRDEDAPAHYYWCVLITRAEYEGRMARCTNGCGAPWRHLYYRPGSSDPWFRHH